ncbi:NAD(P)/FAD-dependent oxidoreductase [bacterium]|nr:NAD(P)/FAD-dependent oxidoreductase [bacterium]
MQIADVIVVGGGAAGLFAGIWAARKNPDARIVVLDGAKRIGAKILIAGGGRCNVAHHQVDEKAFAGSSPAAIRKILRRFEVEQTVAFFQSLGVELKRESTGKLFPVSDRAKTVLDALLRAAESANVAILTSHKVRSVIRNERGFAVLGDWGEFLTGKVVLATGGKSVPQTGSDGSGYSIATSFCHTLTERIFPGLVPLILPPDHFIRALAGISADVEMQVSSGSGRALKTYRNSILCTHFGISGPAVLDISRYYLDEVQNDPHTTLIVNWLPEKSTDQIQMDLRKLNRSSVLSWMRRNLPERLARSLCEFCGVPGETPGYRLAREDRVKLVQFLTRMNLPVTGDRGFQYAEVTAGGVPLKELNLSTLESRLCPGLYLCGEICDVDGRIGGFNFQWAWASGYVTGISIGV